MTTYLTRVSDLTFRSEPGGDPQYGVYFHGERIGVVIQDHSMRPLHWTAVCEHPCPTDEYPGAIRYEMVGWHKNRGEAALLLCPTYED